MLYSCWRGNVTAGSAEEEVAAAVWLHLCCLERSRMENTNAQWKNHPRGGSSPQGSKEQDPLTAKGCSPPWESFRFECRSELPSPSVSSGQNDVVWPSLFCQGLQDNKMTGLSYLGTPVTKSTWYYKHSFES